MTKRFQINLRGMIDLLSNHLYSRPEVFVRELLQNAVDAITARQQRTPEHTGEITLTVTAPRGKPPTLEITDNGVGLTEDEIHRFLATIGETSKRDSQGRRTGDYLGQFGIGLLSCFVASDEIVVVTRSMSEGHGAVEWRGRADGTYSVRSLEADIAPGTTVYLQCRPGQEALFEKDKIQELALFYGGLLPYPIRVASGGTNVIVNAHGAPWRRKYPHDAARTQALLKFGREAFGVSFLDAIPLSSRSGNVDGVAFVLPQATTALARGAHRVYLRNMLLGEEVDNLLPEWAFFVKAIVNANDLRPTASREGFYEDKKLDATREELGRCLRDYLMKLAEQESTRFERFLAVHHLALKALAVDDDECYRLFIDWLPFETTQGSQRLGALRARQEPLRYVTDVTQFHQVEKVASAQGLLLINAGYVYEAELLSRLPEIDPDAEVNAVDPKDLLQDFRELDLDEQERMHNFMEVATRVLRAFHCEADIRLFLPETLPAMFVADADARFFRSLERSQETADPLFQGILGSLHSGHAPTPRTQLLFNGNNSLIRRLADLKSHEALTRAIQVLYVQGLLLAQQPLTTRELEVLSQGLAGLVDLLIEADPTT